MAQCTYGLKKQAAEILIGIGNKRHPFDVETAENHRVPLGEVQHYNDSYYFTGHDSTGNALIMRLGFRGDGSCEPWFSLLFDNKQYNLDGDACVLPGDRRIGDLWIACEEPGKRWKLRFDGGLRSGSKRIPVSLDAEFLSSFPIFNFSSGMPSSTIATSMARERWTREWFRELSGWHQVHYEQNGEIAGSLTIGKKHHTLAMRAIRDHSFGPRRWNDMIRHVWLAAALEDGRFVNYSLVSYPIMSHIRAGFIEDGDRFTTVVGGTRLEAFTAGDPPEKFSVEIILHTGKRLSLDCSNGPRFSWHMGGAYRITEAVASYELNGVPGRGICEFGYRDTGSGKQYE